MFSGLFLRILSVFLIIFLGGLARKKDILDAESTARLALAVKNFFYPALIFQYIFNNFTVSGLAENYLLPAGAFVIMLVGYLMGLAAARFIRFRGGKEKGSFLFQCAINNYSFLPLPIVLMLWGGESAAMLIFSTLGSEIAVWTFGVFALSGNRFRRESLRNLLSAPMVSIIIAIGAVFMRDFLSGRGVFYNGMAAEAGASLMSAVEMLGGATIALAMFVVGSRIFILEQNHIFNLRQFYIVVLRLLLIPAAAIGCLSLMGIISQLTMRLLTGLFITVSASLVVNPVPVKADRAWNFAFFSSSPVIMSQMAAALTTRIEIKIINSVGKRK